MAGEWDVSDLTTYGAEDEEDLELILDALDRATGPQAGACGPDWDILESEPAWVAADLERRDLPEEPGVYLWRRDDRPVYVGVATDLRKRVWGRHLGGGRSLAGSSLRRNVCEVLFAIPPSVTANPRRQLVSVEQAHAIREWLRGCDVSWTVCTSPEEANALERRLREAFLPPLNRV